MDIEGHEFVVTKQLAALCRAGRLIVDSLHMEVHLDFQPTPVTPYPSLGALHGLMSDARACGLVLHHREDNAIGCSRGGCTELSWVSLRHARRVDVAFARRVGGIGRGVPR